ncbi:CvfB family protein [Prevotella sp.]|uniref:CvfB family protein n=1 Tax=Prevotella sp. TaxID=59823 RepID=UPI002F92F609
MPKIKLGDYNTLRVKEEALREGYGELFGMYLDGGVEGEILMPQKYVPENTKPGDEIECFIYLDQDERPIATTEKPLAKVGDFAYLECSWVNEYGAFLNWGLTKDLFCPFREQKRRMEIGDSYIVHVHIDEESYRIVSSAKIEHFLEKPQSAQDVKLKMGDKVDLLVWQKTDLGFKVIVNNQYAGLVYQDQLFKYIHTGDKLPGYVSAIRPDGKLDISLQPIGQAAAIDFATTLLTYMQNNGGRCHLGDKSDPEEIKRQFQVSKKVFKKAIGDLYKKHLITISEQGLELI